MLEEQLTGQIIGAAIEVHRYWGPGLYEEIYLKLTNCKVGLLINFNVPVLKQGIKRMVL